MAQICASAAPISTNVEDIRKSATFHPSVWKNHFLSYNSDATEISVAEKEQHEMLKEKVKNLLGQTANESMIKMELIDAIQRLGIAYHFAKEINESLQEINAKSSKDDDDIRVVALRFRLLRMQGYRASCDVFKKFMDKEGNFKESLINNVEGMLSLYEASYYGVNGEEIMDKALEFFSSHLESLSTTTNSLLKETLETPISKTLNRLGAKKFISVYQENKSHNDDLLHLAKSDFNITQKMHQRELNHITRWWEDLDFTNRVPFARDRLVECYFWILGVYFEPHYNISRIFLTKIIAVTSIIDDIYDVHGTLDELQRFTHVFQSWDINAVDELPAYMKICYEALLGVYAEMGDDISLQYSIQAMKDLVETYMKETEWCYNKYIPVVDEYMKVALISCAYTMLATTCLVGMGDVITIHDFDWIANRPCIVRASEFIGRLMDDLAGYGVSNIHIHRQIYVMPVYFFEQKQKEKKITVVECYMNEHRCSEMEACSQVSKQVKKAWKDINDEWMEPRAASVEIMERIVNFCRVIHLMYCTGEDGYTDSSTRTKHANAIIDLLIHPII